MKHLLNLFAAVALLVWGTQLVRTGVLRVFGAKLRDILARSTGNRYTAVLSGIGVTALVQSSTATSLMTSSFVGQGLIALPAALAVMRGADIGTSLMSVLFSLDLSWLSPLLLFTGVVLFITRQDSFAGRVGRVLIGLGLMLLALRLVVEATEPMLESEAIRAVLASVPRDPLLEIFVGMVLAVVSYSSLAVVLLIATLAASKVVVLDVALGLVLGANLGSGLLAVLTTLKSAAPVRQVTMGNMVFKLLGVACAAPFLGLWAEYVHPTLQGMAQSVVVFHLSFNLAMSIAFLGLTGTVAGWMQRLLRPPEQQATARRTLHLDPSALATPSLAIGYAAREALHQADVVETMLAGIPAVIRGNDALLAGRLRAMDDSVDQLYSAIKYYLTQLSHAQLSEAESRRWTDIIGFTINMEQIGDIAERVLVEIEEKNIQRNRHFSPAGLAEIEDLHKRLLTNLRLGMSVFLNGGIHDAARLLEEKARFGELQRHYAAAHLARLSGGTVSSIETSALHLDLITELKRINSHICSIAYPILESAGALTPSRLREEEG